MNDPVFIIGGSRTGSELIKNILIKYSDIDMAGEMWFLSPRWLHKDFSVMTKSILANDDKTKAVQLLIDLIYSKKLFGSFWNNTEMLDRNKLVNKLNTIDLTIPNIFDALLDAHAKSNNKIRKGAKFPVHYSYIDKLYEWYPNCKVVHTIRDPRAVYASQLTKHQNNPYYSYKNPLSRLFEPLLLFVHVSIQFQWSVKIHFAHQSKANYLLSKYEDLLINPDSSMKKLCSFINVPYKPEMAEPEVTSNTSFRLGDKKSIVRGFQTNAIASWKKNLKPWQMFLFKFFHRNKIIKIGYEL